MAASRWFARRRNAARQPSKHHHTSLILVDSSGWVEYLANGPRAERFAAYLEGREPLLVSAIEIYEP